MSSWFDGNFTEEPKENGEQLENQDSGTVENVEAVDETQPSSAGETRPEDAEKEQQAQPDANQGGSSWYTPGETGYPAGGQTQSGNTTYRYGVNAPKPVPFGSNDYTPPQQPQAVSRAVLAIRADTTRTAAGSAFPWAAERPAKLPAAPKAA